MPPTMWHPCQDSAGTWVRGSFHGHCCESSRCSSVPLVDGLRQYRDIGAVFTAVTDHDVVTDLTEMRRLFPDLILLEGFEYSSRENVAFVGQTVPRLYELPLEQALTRSGDAIVTIVCHPRPHAAGPEYWTLEKLQELGVWPDGIEAYNGHYGTEVALSHGRQPLGTALWDEVLTAGQRLWGFADDDFHDPEDFGNAWNMVQVGEVAAVDIVSAARSGRCYATTGLLLSRLEVDDGGMRVELEAPARGVYVGPGGQVLGSGEGRRFAHAFAGEEYVRFEAEGEAGRIFLQPAFRVGG